MCARHRECLIALILPLFLLIGCGGNQDQPKANANNEYDVKGKVVSVDLAKPTVTLDHEDIPSLMKAMVMEFRVKNAKLLEGLKAGDQVQGRMKKSDGSYMITQLEKK